MTELQQLLVNAVPESWHVNIVGIFAIVGTFRVCLKPIGGLLKSRIVSAMETASNSIDPVDDTWIEAMLHSRIYKVVAFLFDWLASVKLPAAGELHQNQPQIAVRYE